jgi:flagellin
MIAGLSSSGIATAIRTAGRARETMDTMSRQIATGQRVASVKDDGAAWTRANAARADKVQWEGRRMLADRLDLSMQHTKGVVEAHQDIASRLRQVALSATTLPAGSDARRNLQAEWDALIAAGKSTAAGTNPGFADDNVYQSTGAGVGMDVSAHDAYWAGNLYAARSNSVDWTGHYSFVNAGLGITVALDTVDILNGSQAHLQQAMGTASVISGESFNTWNAGWQRQIGADEALLERKRDDITRQLDRLDSSIGSLTDADLGKASAARAQADTRQQLALATVRQAISAYSSFATGLLGNAQRTQRALA